MFGKHDQFASCGPWSDEGAAVVPGRLEEANYGAQLRTWESQDSGLDAAHRPGM